LNDNIKYLYVDIIYIFYIKSSIHILKQLELDIYTT